MSFLADILAVGSREPDPAKAELFLTDRQSWITIGDYPFDKWYKLRRIFLRDHSITSKVAESISDFAIIFINDGFIIFGGYPRTNVIARLDLPTTSWSNIGNLRIARYAHSVIYDGDNFLVVGGYSYNAYKTETCSLSGKGETYCSSDIHNASIIFNRLTHVRYSQLIRPLHHKPVLSLTEHQQ